MKDIEIFRTETLATAKRTLVNKKQEYLNLHELIDEDEKVDFIVSAILKPNFDDGILCITNKRLLFVYKKIKCESIFYDTIINIESKKGFISSSIHITTNGPDYVFDNIVNSFKNEFLQNLEYRKVNYVPVLPVTEDIQSFIVNPNDLSLNPLEKLQLKKFIAENGGLELSAVDEYLSELSESEMNELILMFKQSKNEQTSQSKDNISQPLQQNIQIIQESPKDETQPVCPSCGSKQVSYGKQGFGFGKAIVGGLLTGGIGLLAGGIGRNKILLVCLKCGHKWKLG